MGRAASTWLFGHRVYTLMCMHTVIKAHRYGRLCVDTLLAMLTQGGERADKGDDGGGLKRGGGRQAAKRWRDGGRGSRVDGTNAQPGYHINLAAYKFARDRVKPLQAAGRGARGT